MLRSRFRVPEPHNLTPAELGHFHRLIVVPTRMRVINVVKLWLKKHAYDFEGDERLRLTAGPRRAEIDHVLVDRDGFDTR